ncbi:MAG: 4-demethylwyosine synthase TYW1 [Candidatus Pacearchaeota archaeon]|jgi:tRNA wybutosine-synthesizing protein 1
MLSNKVKQLLKKQHYEIVGEHSAVQVCRWTKKSLRNEGVCYKEKFYGIKSHLCCQMTPSLFCPNSCVHCWRAIEFTKDKKIPGKINSPSEIIDGCINAQRKLLQGFKQDPKSKKKQLSKANQKKYFESQEPMQFAISLSGEPSLYPMLGELISELRRRKKTSFLVTNGLYPEKIKELKNKNQLPTQLYVSVNSTNEKDYKKFHRSIEKDAWKKLNKTLEILPKLNCRTVFRINLIRGINMDDIEGYAKLIKKSSPQFIEVKGYMSVGFARERLGYDRMPTHEEIKKFSRELIKELKGTGYKILGEQKVSRVIVLGKNKKELKIRER